jgi:dihydrofolate reductase
MVARTPASRSWVRRRMGSDRAKYFRSSGFVIVHRSVHHNPFSAEEERMASTVLCMSISLDGFIAGPNESWDDNPLGDDGGDLHGWFPAGVTPGDATSRRASEAINRQIFDELNATGAIVAGAGTFEPAGGWGGDHHDGAPIFIYSRHEPRIDISGWPLVTYVTDVETAMTGAKQAAGEKEVSVHGAAVAQLALAGVRDELELRVVPCCPDRDAGCSTASILSTSSSSGSGSSRASAA